MVLTSRATVVRVMLPPEVGAVTAGTVKSVYGPLPVALIPVGAVEKSTCQLRLPEVVPPVVPPVVVPPVVPPVELPLEDFPPVIISHETNEKARTALRQVVIVSFMMAPLL